MATENKVDDNRGIQLATRIEELKERVRGVLEEQSRFNLGALSHSLGEVLSVLREREGEGERVSRKWLEGIRREIDTHLRIKGECFWPASLARLIVLVLAIVLLANSISRSDKELALLPGLAIGGLIAILGEGLHDDFGSLCRDDAGITATCQALLDGFERDYAETFTVSQAVDIWDAEGQKRPSAPSAAASMPLPGIVGVFPSHEGREERRRLLDTSALVDPSEVDPSVLTR